MANLLNGKEIAAKLNAELKNNINLFLEKHNRPPALTIISVGNDFATQTYVRSKKNMSEKLGVSFNHINMEENISTQNLLDLIKKINDDHSVDGLLVQLPLPKHIDKDKVIQSIDHKKDVDGFHPHNLGLLFTDIPNLIPCTAQACLTLLEHTRIKLEGLKSVVLGRSLIVGKPVSILLLSKNMTVTICHSKTRNIEEILKDADIVVAAIGKARFVKGEWLKKDSIVIDVGFNYENEKTVGDVDFDSACKVASWITPVPKGVGPLTVHFLMSNTFKAYKQNYSI